MKFDIKKVSNLIPKKKIRLSSEDRYSGAKTMKKEIKIIQRYLKTEKKKNILDFTLSLLTQLENIPPIIYPEELKTFIEEWAETAEIYLDKKLMSKIKAAEEDFKTGGGIKWTPPKDSI